MSEPSAEEIASVLVCSGYATRYGAEHKRIEVDIKGTVYYVYAWQKRETADDPSVKMWLGTIYQPYPFTSKVLEVKSENGAYTICIDQNIAMINGHLYCRNRKEFYAGLLIGKRYISYLKTWVQLTCPLGPDFMPKHDFALNDDLTPVTGIELDIDNEGIKLILSPSDNHIGQCGKHFSIINRSYVVPGDWAYTNTEGLYAFVSDDNIYALVKDPMSNDVYLYDGKQKIIARYLSDLRLKQVEGEHSYGIYEGGHVIDGNSLITSYGCYLFESIYFTLANLDTPIRVNKFNVKGNNY